MTTTTTATAGDTTDTTATTTDTKAFEPITSQDDLNKIIQKRVERERAGFADYAELKAKAEKFDEIDAANKTEAQIATEKLAAAEQRAKELELKATRAEVAAAKGVPADLLTGSTQAELESAADALIAFRGEKVAARLTIPGEGNSPAKKVDGEVREFAKNLFGSPD